ncbi:MAG: uracil-DNA glycosylase family protein [Gaiellaceae bacterium]
MSELAVLQSEAAGCTRCRLSEGRTQVVFGSGSPDADLLFVGEAPGFHEDQQGVPFVGQAGKLLDKLLAGIGLTRADVYIANVLKCLRYNTPVQLADGSWERVGRLVRSRYTGEVMSVDADGSLVARRVIGWHATPVSGRRVFRLTYRSAKNAGAGRVGIELTGDHPVLTERGYVPVEALKPGDRIATGQGLSSVAFDVLCGTLLGDGHISKRSAHLAFGHTERQGAYALFKADLLAELSPRIDELMVAAVVGGERAHPVVQVRTLAHRAIGVLRSDFYKPTKRVPSWVTEKLNDRMLAIWFMDDGHLRVRTGRQPIAEIATNGFPNSDLRILQRALLRLGLPARIRGGRLHFDVQATRELSARIAPYVPPSMRYKLHPEHIEGRPHDQSRLSAGQPQVLFDEIEVEDVTDRPRTDTTFFCIDVEETHNFVTAGGVVHNCRPPGNRDPQADEISSCESYLFRQIELIQPKVVATLGNFATKLLSGKPLGITRVHGQEQETVLGGQRVLLYPLYHPAAALYTPAMLKVLEADFARLPELLGRPATPEVPETPPLVLPAFDEEPAVERDAVQLGLF